MSGSDQALKVLQNAPLKVEYSGLVGTTRSMQSAGWQINVETYRMVCRDAFQLRLFGKHPTQNIEFISYPQLLERQFMFEVLNRGVADISMALPPIQMHHMAANLMMQVRSIADIPRAHPVDFSNPSLEEISKPMVEKMMKLEDCMFFKSFNEEATIYVPENKIWTVQEHLNAIIEMQKPFQAELREKKRKEELRGVVSGGSMDIDDLNGVNAKKSTKLQLVAVA